MVGDKKHGKRLDIVKSVMDEMDEIKDGQQKMQNQLDNMMELLNKLVKNSTVEQAEPETNNDQTSAEHGNSKTNLIQCEDILDIELCDIDELLVNNYEGNTESFDKFAEHDAILYDIHQLFDEMSDNDEYKLFEGIGELCEDEAGSLTFHLHKKLIISVDVQLVFVENLEVTKFGRRVSYVFYKGKDQLNIVWIWSNKGARLKPMKSYGSRGIEKQVKQTCDGLNYCVFDRGKTSDALGMEKPIISKEQLWYSLNQTSMKSVEFKGSAIWIFPNTVHETLMVIKSTTGVEGKNLIQYYQVEYEWKDGCCRKLPDGKMCIYVAQQHLHFSKMLSSLTLFNVPGLIISIRIKCALVRWDLRTCFGVFNRGKGQSSQSFISQTKQMKKNIHESSKEGHFGIDTTDEIMGILFYWTKKIVVSFGISQIKEQEHEKSPGLLQSLFVPQETGQEITIALIEETSWSIIYFFSFDANDEATVVRGVKSHLLDMFQSCKADIYDIVIYCCHLDARVLNNLVTWNKGVMKTIDVNKLTKSGCMVKIWIEDWFSQLNIRMGGDLKRIMGEYLIEIWKAVGMDVERGQVEFLWSLEEINSRAHEYWPLVRDIARRNKLPWIMRCCQIIGWLEHDLFAAQIFYMCLEGTDVFFLKAYICQLGMDQRKVNVFAREYCDDIKNKNKNQYWRRASIDKFYCQVLFIFVGKFFEETEQLNILIQNAIDSDNIHEKSAKILEFLICENCRPDTCQEISKERRAPYPILFSAIKVPFLTKCILNSYPCHFAVVLVKTAVEMFISLGALIIYFLERGNMTIQLQAMNRVAAEKCDKNDSSKLEIDEQVGFGFITVIQRSSIPNKVQVGLVRKYATEIYGGFAVLSFVCALLIYNKILTLIAIICETCALISHISSYIPSTRKMVKTKNVAMVHVLINWTHFVEHEGTWEDGIAMNNKFPDYETCGQVSSEGGSNVTSLNISKALNWKRRVSPTAFLLIKENINYVFGSTNATTQPNIICFQTWRRVPERPYKLYYLYLVGYPKII